MYTRIATLLGLPGALVLSTTLSGCSIDTGTLAGQAQEVARPVGSGHSLPWSQPGNLS